MARKRKIPASGLQPGVGRATSKRGKHAANTVEAIDERDTSSARDDPVTDENRCNVSPVDDLESAGAEDLATSSRSTDVVMEEKSNENAAPLDDAPSRKGGIVSLTVEDHKEVGVVRKKTKRKKGRKALGDDPSEKLPDKSNPSNLQGNIELVVETAEMDLKRENTSISNNLLPLIEEEDDASKGTDSHPGEKLDMAADMNSCSHEVKSTSSQKTRTSKQKKTKPVDISVEEDVPNLSGDNSCLSNISSIDTVRKDNSDEPLNTSTHPLVIKEDASLTKGVDVGSTKSKRGKHATNTVEAIDDTSSARDDPVTDENRCNVAPVDNLESTGAEDLATSARSTDVVMEEKSIENAAPLDEAPSLKGGIVSLTVEDHTEVGVVRKKTKRKKGRKALGDDPSEKLPDKSNPSNLQGNIELVVETAKMDLKSENMSISNNPLPLIEEEDDASKGIDSHPGEKLDMAADMNSCSHGVKTTSSQKTRISKQKKTKPVDISVEEDVPNLSGANSCLSNISSIDTVRKDNSDEPLNTSTHPLVNKEDASLTKGVDVGSTKSKRGKYAANAVEAIDERDTSSTRDDPVTGENRCNVASVDNLESTGAEDLATSSRSTDVVMEEKSIENAAPLDEAPSLKGGIVSLTVEDHTEGGVVRKKTKRKKGRKALGDDPSEKLPEKSNPYNLQGNIELVVETAEMDLKSENTSTSDNPLPLIGEEDDASKGTDSHPVEKLNMAADMNSCSHEVKTTSSQKTRSSKLKKAKPVDISVEEDVPNLSGDNLCLSNISSMNTVRKDNCDEPLNTSTHPLVYKEDPSLTKGVDVGSTKSNVGPATDSSFHGMKTYTSKRNKRVTQEGKNIAFCSSESFQGNANKHSTQDAQNCTSISGSKVTGVGSVNENDKGIPTSDSPVFLAKEEDLLETVETVNEKKTDVSPEIDLNSSEATNASLRHHKKHGKKKNKNSSTSSVAEADSSSLSEIMEIGPVEIINGTSLSGSLVSSIEKENSGLVGGDSNKTDKLLEMNMNSDIVKNNSSCTSKKSQRKEKKKACDYSEYNVELDRTDSSAVNSSLSVELGLVQKNNGAASARNDEVLNIGINDSGQTNIAGSCSPNETCSSPGMASNSFQAEDSDLIQTKTAKKNTSKSSNRRLCPSPIRGVIDDFASTDLQSKQNNQFDSVKEEDVGFSFQIADKVLLDNSSGSHFEKACQSGNGAGSENVSPTTYNALDSMCTCASSKAIDCHGKKQAASSISSDVSRSEAKKLDAVLPERTSISCRRKKLLVLDLNGLLADIITDFRNAHKAQKRVGGKAGEIMTYVFKRPFCDDFLKFCFDRFEIGVWSSRKKYNVDDVVDYLMGDTKHNLLFCWDQSKCTITGYKTIENMHKPLVLKELKKLWNKEEPDLPWEKGEYLPSNTLLVDDSPYKALCNPPHTAIFPIPYQFNDKNDTSLGPGGDLRVYLEGLAMADDVQQYVKEHAFGQHAITATDPSWKFYLQIIDKIENASALT